MNDITEVLNRISQLAIAGLPGAIAVIVGTIVVLFLANRGYALLVKTTRFSEAELAVPKKVGNWLILAIAFLLLISVFGFDIGGFWTMLSTVLALIAIGFVAVWSLLSNVSCTVLIILFRPFGVGDRIEFAGDDSVNGRVIDLNFLYTTLETDDGALLQIPNNLFFQKVVKRVKGVESVSLTEQLKKEEPADATSAATDRPSAA